MKASENPHAERAHMGSQSDIDLVPHPQCPAGVGQTVHQYGTSDVSVTTFMQATDNDAAPEALRTRDHKTRRYDMKCQHHSARSRDAPIVFDTTAMIETRSRTTLLALLGTEQKHHLRLFLQQVTAALARMIGLLDRRNLLRRMQQAGLGTHQSDDDAEAWALHLAEQRDRSLDYPDRRPLLDYVEDPVDIVLETAGPTDEDVPTIDPVAIDGVACSTNPDAPDDCALNVLGGFVGSENAMSSEVSPTDSEDANGANYPSISSATESAERELFVSAATVVARTLQPKVTDLLWESP